MARQNIDSELAGNDSWYAKTEMKREKTDRITSD